MVVLCDIELVLYAYPTEYGSRYPRNRYLAPLNAIILQKLFCKLAVAVVNEVEESSFNINWTDCWPSPQAGREGLTGVYPPYVNSIVVGCDRDICRLQCEA